MASRFSKGESGTRACPLIVAAADLRAWTSVGHPADRTWAAAWVRAIVLLAAGLVAASKDVGRKGNAGQPQRGYLFLSKPWS